MARPKRTFTGQEGQRATGSAGPDPIRRDLDALFAMMDPESTLPTGEPGGIDPSENVKTVVLDPNQAPTADAGKIPTLLSGIVNRIKAIMGTADWKNDPPGNIAGLHNAVTNITVNPNLAPQSDTGNLGQMLSWITNRLRAITGKADWKDDPAVNLQQISELATHEDVSFHAIAKSGVHGVGEKYVAKTSRSDQWPSWNDIPDKPALFPTGPHQHSASDVVGGQFPPERIGNLPASKINSGVFDAARIPLLPASHINSGVFSQDRLPPASLQQRGIVQLTNSRSSTSDELAVTAKALNDHRVSADHDARYYTRAEVNQLLTAWDAARIRVGDYIGDGTDPRLIEVGFQPRFVYVMGFYTYYDPDIDEDRTEYLDRMTVLGSPFALSMGSIAHTDISILGNGFTVRREYLNIPGGVGNYISSHYYWVAIG